MIIVTGGAGFIGSNLVQGLEAKGYRDIVVCDVLGKENKWRNLAKRELRDVVHPSRLMEYLERYKDDVETIFHMGAISSTTEYDSDLVIDTNFVTSRNLWKFCAANDIRFIYSSSAATYVNGDQGFVDDETPEALAKLRPLNPYGWSKNLFDRRISRIIDSKDKTAIEPIPPQWVGLKFFNVYGPNEYHKGEQMSVISKLYPQVALGASAKLFKSYNPDYEDGGQLRDFVYVRDCVDVMLWFLDNEQVNGLYNFGTGKARSFKDLALATFKAAGKEPKIQYIDMPEVLKDKYQYFTEADMEKLKKAGYDKPFTSLEDGVQDYIQKYASQSDQYL